MNNQHLDLFSQLRTLSSKYYDREITFVDYRNQRNQLLDKINARYNGITTSM